MVNSNKRNDVIQGNQFFIEERCEAMNLSDGVLVKTTVHDRMIHFESGISVSVSQQFILGVNFENGEFKKLK